MTDEVGLKEEEILQIEEDFKDKMDFKICQMAT